LEIVSILEFKIWFCPWKRVSQG